MSLTMSFYIWYEVYLLRLKSYSEQKQNAQSFHPSFKKSEGNQLNLRCGIETLCPGQAKQSPKKLFFGVTVKVTRSFIFVLFERN